MFPGLWMIKQQQSWSGELGLCGVGDTSRYSFFCRVPKRGGCSLQHDIRTSRLTSHQHCMDFLSAQENRTHTLSGCIHWTLTFEMQVNLDNAERYRGSVLATKVDPRPWHLVCIVRYCHVLSMWNDLFDCHLEQVDVNSVDVNLFHALLWFIVVH